METMNATRKALAFELEIAGWQSAANDLREGIDAERVRERIASIDADADTLVLFTDRDPARDEIIASALEIDALALFTDATYSGPGRMEGCSDRVLALALDIVYISGFADATGGNVDFGSHGARCANFILWTDSQGFCDVSTYDSEQKAQDALELESAGGDAQAASEGLDPMELRDEAARLIGMDYLPVEALREIVDTYGPEAS